MSELPLLLDDGHIEGPHAVERVVGPERVAAVVDQSDLSDARAALEDLCLAWGGGCGALLPAERDRDGLPVRWDRFREAGVFDRLGHRDVIQGQSNRPRVFSTAEVGGDPLLAVLWNRHDREGWATADCSLPDSDDPWHVAYLACLGAWPSQPASRHLAATGLVEDYRFERLLRVKRDVIEAPGPADLVARPS